MRHGLCMRIKKSDIQERRGCDMRLFIIGVSASLCFFIVFPSHVLAARSMTITSDKTSLFGDEEMTITASASGFTPGETIYIKGAFYQEGSTNYFGFTRSGDSWIKNGDTSTSQRSIVVDSWDGTLSVKSDFADSGYKGEGEYKVKVGFYYTTSGGNLSSVNWTSNNVTVSLNEPDPTPTPTPTSTPTPTPTPQATATPTSTPTPTKTLTPTKTPIPTQSPTPTPTPTPTEIPEETPEATPMVLGESVEIKTSSPSSYAQNNSWKPLVISMLFVATGLAILSGFYTWKIAREKYLSGILDK